MKRFLFLDIDGVLNSHRSLFSKIAEHYKLSYSDNDFSEKYWNSVDGINPDLMVKINKIKKSKKFSFPDVSMFNFPFDNICIDNCNKIIKDNDNPGVVVISTWRIGRTIQDLQKLFNNIGLICDVKGRTGDEETRGLEIYQWINYYQKKYDTKIESICILDDDHAYDIDYILGDFTVKDITSIRNGLRKKHIKESKNIFNKLFDINKINKL